MSSKTARRKHGDYIDVLPDSLLSLNRDVDVMFEAKMKEQAVLRYRGIMSGEIQTDRTTFEVPMTLTVEEMKEEKKLLKKTKSPSKTVSHDFHSTNGTLANQTLKDGFSKWRTLSVNNTAKARQGGNDRNGFV